MIIRWTTHSLAKQMHSQQLAELKEDKFRST